MDLAVDTPETVKRAIEVEKEGSGPIEVELEVQEDGLGAEVKADRLSNLRAGINTIIRLVKTSENATRR